LSVRPLSAHDWRYLQPPPEVGRMNYPVWDVPRAVCHRRHCHPSRLQSRISPWGAVSISSCSSARPARRRRPVARLREAAEPLLHPLTLGFARFRRRHLVHHRTGPPAGHLVAHQHLRLGMAIEWTFFVVESRGGDGLTTVGSLSPAAHGHGWITCDGLAEPVIINGILRNAHAGPVAADPWVLGRFLQQNVLAGPGAARSWRRAGRLYAIWTASWLRDAALKARIRA